LAKNKKKVEELQSKLVTKTEELMEAQKTWMELKEFLRKKEDEVQKRDRRSAINILRTCTCAMCQLCYVSIIISIKLILTILAKRMDLGELWYIYNL